MVEDDGFMYFPIKRQLSGIDKEILLYDSMYPANNKSDPLKFWESKANNEHLLHLGSANFGKNCEERLICSSKFRIIGACF